MPVLSSFYGIRVLMHTYDNKQHHLPHIHVCYQDTEAVISIADGELLAGKLPPKKLRMVQTWIDIHTDELMQCWNLAVNGIEPLRIIPLC
ncbi:MAG: DUF4160 domain-containing protein [Planctomycetaceae bacterium]|jgi:hypothetical protein|nr:DUF4160 domain-containing protein [Planctomycetaceae bacterium]